MRSRSIIALALFGALGVHAEPAPEVLNTFRQNCIACHSDSVASGGVNLQKLTSEEAFGADFKQWQKVIDVLETQRMPPKGMPAPDDAARAHALSWIRAGLDEHIQEHAGDPGAVTVRRLTSAEYAYTIEDLTGLEIRPDFSSDSVGGEGFTNYGDVQFMLDATMERYLESAKKVAEHAVIGSGPLRFYRDPGKSGFELASIHRIQEIYEENGFRAAAAEGGTPFGMWRYANACFVGWQDRYRKELGLGDKSLAELAEPEDVSVRFVEHILAVLKQDNPTFPTSEAVKIFNELPPPGTPEEQVRKACDEIELFVINWPRRLYAAGELAKGGAGDERALVIDQASIQPKKSDSMRFIMRNRGRNRARIFFEAVPMNPAATARPVIVWKGGSVRFFKEDRSRSEPQALVDLLTEESRAKVMLGQAPDGSALDADAFAMLPGDEPIQLDVDVPEGSGGLALSIDVEVREEGVGGSVLRTTISSDREASRGRPTYALLGNPESEGFKAWEAGVLEFAGNLPQVSQGEPYPADRDPIPPPYNNDYNQPERDEFHQRVKYYRRDAFIMDKILSEASRKELDDTWADLLTSFEYHDAFMTFVCKKFGIELGERRMANLDPEWVAVLPDEPRGFIQALKDEYDTAMARRKAAEPGHVHDAVAFAERAWRRPLSQKEKDELVAFYDRARTELELDHDGAIRAMLARILVAPSFLYRLEKPVETTEAAPLDDYEMANRLSYFLWSSPPDQELMELAAAGKLSDSDALRAQVERMLKDEKARRFAAEFFGQWLGFYRFDEYKGVDITKFPTFDDKLRESMYDEAVSFFEYVVRQDRPVRDILFADYAFLNKPLAEHYGIEAEALKPDTEFYRDRVIEVGGDELVLVENAGEMRRGGLLRLGAVLTATSAPLRTSPVKRGDWVLRRVVGTPTPPPPPDAGSLPADEKAFGDLTIYEKLEAHKRNPTCFACHSRIDPLGFPLENYDAVGRWRETYQDGNDIHVSGVLFDGTEINGLDGLIAYLEQQESQVRRNMATKMLGYALGRTVQASDLPLVEKLVDQGGEATFAELAETIVTSKQFRFRRGAQQVSENDGVDVAASGRESRVGGEEE